MKKNNIQETQLKVYKWSHIGKNQGMPFSEDVSIAINPITREPWIVYKNSSRILNVKKYDGVNWVNVGNMSDIVGSSDNISDNVRPQIVFNPITNIPYITFQVTDGFVLIV